MIWRQHDGAGPPDDVHVLSRRERVTVMERDGTVTKRHPITAGWHHRGWEDDVMAYVPDASEEERQLRRMQDRQDASFDPEPSDHFTVIRFAALMIGLGIVGFVGFIVAASYAVEWAATWMEKVL